MPKERPRQSQALFWPSGNRASERAQAPPPLSARRMGSSVFLLAAFRRAVRSRGPPTTSTDRHPHHPSNPPAAPQQQTNNSLNFKQLLHKAAASQQHVADTNWQLTCTHTLCRDSNFLCKDKSDLDSAARSCAPRGRMYPQARRVTA